MIWKASRRTFSAICQYRYAFISRVEDRRRLQREGKTDEVYDVPARFVYGYHDLPNKQLKKYSLFAINTKAQDVDYDLILYDTYDFLDKLIGFKLSDIFYAILHQYHEAQNDDRALRLANFIKYGTDNEREIWMLRYGLLYEDIEWADPCIDSISEEEIVFNEKVYDLAPEKRSVIEPFLHISQ